MTDLKVIEAAALALPPEDRELLARHLLESLDELDEVENEGYLEEADQRYRAYRDGSLPSRDAFEALADIRSRLK